MRALIRAFLLLGVFTFSQLGTLQAQSYFKKKLEDFHIEPYLMLQLWSTYTLNQEVWDDETNQYLPVDNRFNVQLRRGRFGVKGEPYEGLKFNVALAYDLIGRDGLSGTVGGYNLSTPNVGIWDAFLQWRILKGKETFYLTGGYFRPQLSRESITSGWSVNSMEKSMSQNYLRRHLVGTGPGRTTGLNLGGLLANGNGKPWLNYNFGIFTPLSTSAPGSEWFLASAGSKVSPLLVGRAVLYLGDPEQKTYKIGYDINYFNQRKGVSLGVGGSWQGETEMFQQNTTLSFDILANYGSFNVDAEANFMSTQSSRNLDSVSIREFTYPSFTGHFRVGYNIILGKKYFLEPTFMVMTFQGAMDATGQDDARALLFFGGSETTFDAGVNWYLNKKNLKLLLHYTWHTADPGEAGNGSTLNQYYLQSLVGPIQRGNWLGLGLHIIVD